MMFIRALKYMLIIHLVHASSFASSQPTMLIDEKSNTSAIKKIASIVTDKAKKSSTIVNSELVSMLSKLKFDNKIIDLINMTEPSQRFDIKILPEGKGVDKYLILATEYYYKREGYILFFNLSKGTYLGGSADFHLGIENFEVTQLLLDNPKLLVTVKYMSGVGTGWVAYSKNIYAINNTRAWEVASIPIDETLSQHWGEFIFKQVVSIDTTKSRLEINTSGYLTSTALKDKQKHVSIPESTYVWEGNKFWQIKGRINAQTYLSSLYGDLTGSPRLSRDEKAIEIMPVSSESH